MDRREPDTAPAQEVATAPQVAGGSGDDAAVNSKARTLK
jgi:hypothetical protein